MEQPRKLDQDALRAACFAVARSTMWDLRPIDVRSIENVADQFFKIAAEHQEFIVGQERDPNLITRAVIYLAHTQAIPPMRDDTHWFQDMLSALIELACPNTLVSAECEMFYCDIKDGIAQAQANYES